MVKPFCFGGENASGPDLPWLREIDLPAKGD